jgi:hypothetical protein
VGTVRDVRERIRRGQLHLVEAPARPEGLVPVGSTVSGAAGAAREGYGEGLVLPARSLPRPGNKVGAPQRAWPAIQTKLADDPALRYTEGGRAFLRWMATHSMQADEWRGFIEAIPQRWLNEVSHLAASMSEEWRRFAEQLRCEQENGQLIEI